MKIKGIKYLVILTLSGKAKLSMASCSYYKAPVTMELPIALSRSEHLRSIKQMKMVF